MPIEVEVGKGNGKPVDYAVLRNTLDRLLQLGERAFTETSQHIPDEDPVRSVFRSLGVDDEQLARITEVLKRSPELRQKVDELYDVVDYTGSPMYA